MTKVSLIIPSFEVGGTESSFIRKANFLKNTDFIPEMVYWTEGGELRKNLNSSIKVVKLNAPSLWQLFFQFINYFNKSKPKVIHTPTFMVANIALIARIFSSHKPKIIIGARSDFDSVCKASKNYFDELKLRKLSQFLYPKSDRIVAVSKGVKNSLLTSLDIEDSKIEVIYNGILTKKHRDNYEKPNHPWFVSKEICLISSIGRLSPEKGIYELVCAFRKALKLNSSLRLLIIGEGDEEKKIRIVKRFDDAFYDVDFILCGMRVATFTKTSRWREYFRNRFFINASRTCGFIRRTCIGNYDANDCHQRWWRWRERGGWHVGWSGCPVSRAQRCSPRLLELANHSLGSMQQLVGMHEQEAKVVVTDCR